MTTIETDLNATITGAVNARIEAEVLKALSGDEVIGQFVAAALRQEVEVRTNSYDRKKVTFLTKVLHDAIRDATQSAVRRTIAEELPTIEDEVRKALKRETRRIAETLANSLADAADKAYGVNVELSLKMPRHDG